jgi:hypothetical protein
MKRSVLTKRPLENYFTGNFFAAEPLKCSLPRTPFAMLNAVAWLM